MSLTPDNIEGQVVECLLQVTRSPHQILPCDEAAAQVPQGS